MKGVLSLLIIVLLTGCSSTKLIGSLKVGEGEPKKYQKLGVVVLSPKMYNRSVIEMAVAGKLRSKGVGAIATFDIFPLAGKIGEIKKDAGMDQDAVKKKVQQRVNDNKLDALLIITLLDKQKETQYVQGSGFTLSAPVYGYPYYGYYGYAYSTVYSPGYYTTSTKYFVESNLYDVATEKLLWTGQTKTQDPESIEKEAENYADIIVSEILAKKALAP